MNETSFLDLIHNAALLLAIALLFDLVVSRSSIRKSIFWKLVLGVLLGGIGIAVMMTPWILAPGIIFDTRSVLLGISGLFFGSIPTLIAMAMTAAFRFSLGGAAVWMGISVILATGTIGIAWRKLFHKPLEAITGWQLYLFGVVIHIVMLACTFVLPGEIVWNVLANISLPVMVIYPFGTLLLGLLMTNRLRREQLTNELQVSEERLKLTAAELEKRERQYRLLTENIKDVVWVLDTETMYFRYVSPSVEKLRGYTAEEILAKPVNQAITDEASTDLIDLIRKRASDMETGKEPSDRYYTDEVEQPRKDGSTVWTEMITSYYVNPENDRVEVRGVTRDITERKRTEAVLEKSEALLSKTQELARIGSWELDLISNQLTWTDEVYRIFGLTPQEIPVTYDTFLEMVHPEDRKTVEDAYSSSLREGKVSYEIEHRVICKYTGEIRAVYEKCVHTRNEAGEIVKSIGMVQDITERKQVEEKLLREKIISDAIFASVPGLLFLYDEDGYLLRWNKRHEEITGYSFEELDHFHLLDWFKGEPEDTERITQGVQKALAEGFATAEGNLIIKDGSKILFDFTAARLEIEGKVYFTGIGIDITERRKDEEKIRAAQVELQRLLAETERSRLTLLSLVEDQKLAEEKIRQLNAELEQRVRDRTAQLETANNELEAFSYSVSHDLRAPLRALDGFSGILMKEYEGQLDAQGQHYLTRIQEASRRMGQLIEDLLNLSRVTRREMNRRPVDLTQEARQIAGELTKQDLSRQVEFDIAPNLVVEADPNLMRIVMENLLNNAYKFTNQCEHSHIQVGVNVQADERIYFIRDNGAGFDMAYADKLFVPFQRLHSVREFSGTGIGLVTVKRIITRHGGRVWAEATPNHGAIFYFTLGES